MSGERNLIFGGTRGWQPSDWTSSDDRVRGGRSQSYLNINDDTAIFCGHLDIETLGGAGFASQRTTGDDQHWDFSAGVAVELLIDVTQSDHKRYTFNLKDELLPPNPDNGREQSTTSWEYDFDLGQGTIDKADTSLVSFVIPWDKFTPTYRGKEKDPGRSIKLQDIRRMGIMMRSFFGDQQGDFALGLKHIALVGGENNMAKETSPSLSISTDTDSMNDLKSAHLKPATQSTSIWSRIFTLCNKI